jgi:hypothetical protein
MNSGWGDHEPYPEYVPQLLDDEDDGDARGEAGDHREWNELDGAAELGQAESDQQQPRHDGRHGEPVHAVLLHDPVDDHHEGAGRATDLHP